MTKRKITKKEKSQIVALILGISAYSFLQQPVQNIISKFGLSDIWLVIIGVGFIVGVYKLLDLA